MAHANPALRDRELPGIAGMLAWGVPSSVLLVTGAMFSGSPLFMYTPGLIILMVVWAALGLVVAAVVWGIGAVFVALPVWFTLVAVGMHGSRLTAVMTVLGAVAVGLIWALFTQAPIGTPGFWLPLGLGALSGGLGAYGFCRGAMRS